MKREDQTCWRRPQTRPSIRLEFSACASVPARTKATSRYHRCTCDQRRRERHCARTHASGSPNVLPKVLKKTSRRAFSFAVFTSLSSPRWFAFSTVRRWPQHPADSPLDHASQTKMTRVSFDPASTSSRKLLHLRSHFATGISTRSTRVQCSSLLRIEHVQCAMHRCPVDRTHHRARISANADASANASQGLISVDVRT